MTTSRPTSVNSSVSANSPSCFVATEHLMRWPLSVLSCTSRSWVTRASTWPKSSLQSKKSSTITRYGSERTLGCTYISRSIAKSITAFRICFEKCRGTKYYQKLWIKSQSPFWHLRQILRILLVVTRKNSKRRFRRLCESIKVSGFKNRKMKTPRNNWKSKGGSKKKNLRGKCRSVERR